jgi:hypothetical protein
VIVPRFGRARLSGELGADAGADESIAVRGAPGPGGVDDALAAARARLASI